MKCNAFECEKLSVDAAEPVVDAAADCVRNSAGPIQSLNPDGFSDATRTKYEVSGFKFSITYVIPSTENIYLNHICLNVTNCVLYHFTIDKILFNDSSI